MIFRKVFGLSAFLLVMLTRTGFAHTTTDVSIKKTPTPITIDGKLNEDIWNQLGVESALAKREGLGFYQVFPTDSLKAADDTYIMLSYDDEMIYVAGICFESQKKDAIIQSLRRDFSWQNNENLSVYFDPYND